MDRKYHDLFSYISDTDESCASDILYSLELVKTSLNTTLKRIKKEIQIATDNDAFDGISQIAGYCKQIAEINQEIEELISALHFDSNDAPDVSLPSTNPNTSSATIDYSQFDVSQTEPHTLDEDFENKKVCALNVLGTHIPVDSWQDALVKLCAYLYKLNPAKIESFVGNAKFSGKKNNYFMTESVPQRNKHIPGSNLYVWTNNSANKIVTIIRNALKEYGIPANKVTVYLRRDLSPLHE